jgi:hypothetical protein
MASQPLTSNDAALKWRTLENFEHRIASAQSDGVKATRVWTQFDMAEGREVGTFRSLPNFGRGFDSPRPF